MLWNVCSEHISNDEPEFLDLEDIKERDFHGAFAGYAGDDFKTDAKVFTI
jgi:hypothetical protein